MLLGICCELYTHNPYVRLPSGFIHIHFLFIKLYKVFYIKMSFCIREDVKIPTYKPHTNHKRSSVRSHILAPTTICDLSHSLCWRPLTDLGHISSVTYVCHPLWFVCGHRKGILTSPLSSDGYYFNGSSRPIM